MKKLLGLGFAAILGVFIYACGSNSSTVAISSLHDGSYTGAGSVWTWNLTAAGTFTAVKKTTSATVTDELNITGTYQTFSTGFYKFTVSSCTGTDLGQPVAGDTAYGFAVPGVVLIVKPTGSGSESLVMPVLSGACPTFPVSFNWVQASINGAGGGAMENAEIGGNATITGETALLSGNRWTMDGAASAMGTPPTFTGCSDGKLTFSGGHVALTSAGVGIVNNEGGSGDIIAFPRDESVTAATLAGRNFVGLVFNESGGGGDKTKPINISFDGNSAGTYSMLSDVETGAVGETGPVAVLATGTGQQAGFLKLRANASGDDIDSTPPTMWAAVATLSGHVAFFASGFNQNSDLTAVDGDNFSVIAVEK